MVVVPSVYGTGGKFPRWPTVSPVADLAKGLSLSHMGLPIGLLGYSCHVGLKSKLRREEEKLRE